MKSGLEFNKKVWIMIVIMCVITNMAFSQSLKDNPKIKTIEITEEKYDDSKVNQNKVYQAQYDRNGNVTDEINYKNGSFESHFSYKYDSANNKTEETEYDKSGKIIKVSRYKYVNNLKTEKTVFDSKGKLKSKKVYKYTTY